METKKCTKCNIEKNLTEYTIRKKAKDGLHSNCKSCNLAYKTANKEKIRIQSKEYYAKVRSKKPKKKININKLITTLVNFVSRH